MTIIRIGLDTAKHVFQVHGVDENEQTVVRRHGFRMPAGRDLSAGAEGRRPKAPQEGTRGGWSGG
jgi:hypothetical protein